MEIVATFVPGNAEPAEELRRPPGGASMVELRADLLGPDVDLTPLVAASPLPVIVTLRSSAEGGQGPDDPQARRRFFLRAVACDAALFDLEVARDADLVGTVVPAERTVLSAHFGGGIPADLETRAARVLAAKTRVAKIVPEARNLDDLLSVLRLAQALERGAPASRRAVVFATGEAGRASRLLSPLLGAPLAFAAWDETRRAAPGQYTAEELVALIGHLHGRPRRVCAVLGKPVGGSLSPRMHAAAYRAVGLPDAFVPIEVSDESELDRLLQPSGETCLDRIGLSVGGYAVTMPWKEAAAKHCSLLAPRAERAGVANTVLPRVGKLLGDCTDIDGITRVLAEEGVELAGRRGLVLGSGGAARAAAVALTLAGAAVTIVARDRDRATRAARAVAANVGEMGASADAAAVVNATPAGADGAATPWLEALRLPAGAVAVDLPYGERLTFLAQLAQARGWRYVSGREVLLFQGVAQFAAMTGVAPPVRAMATALGLEEAQS
jgi:shikimate dehydrogenase/3-dehydroquinate dehydratase type I